MRPPATWSSLPMEWGWNYYMGRIIKHGGHICWKKRDAFGTATDTHKKKKKGNQNKTSKQ